MTGSTARQIHSTARKKSFVRTAGSSSRTAESFYLTVGSFNRMAGAFDRTAGAFNRAVGRFNRTGKPSTGASTAPETAVFSVNRLEKATSAPFGAFRPNRSPSDLVTCLPRRSPAPAGRRRVTRHTFAFRRTRRGGSLFLMGNPGGRVIGESTSQWSKSVEYYGRRIVCSGSVSSGIRIYDGAVRSEIPGRSP
jgi:hypothetical protein